VTAVVQAFFPGEEGGPALAGVLSGRVTPSGKLPVQVPRTAGGQPGTYLHAPLGGNTQGVSNLDPTPAYPFGHGLSYTSFAYDELELSAEQVPTDGEVEISCAVRNTGDRPGTEIVQLYTADPIAQLPRPVTQLTGFARVELTPGEQRKVTFRLHADRLAYTGPDLHRIVEPGEINVMLGASSADIRLTGTIHLTGPIRRVGHDRALHTPTHIA
jgi:beta-glucosidase